MNIMEGGSITSPKGFRAAGVHCGLKKQKKDLALVVSEVPCAIAGVFTKNIVAAAPVLYGRALIKRKVAQALVINAGNANACTGEQGYSNAQKTAELVGKVLQIDAQLVVPSSTGVIGYQLPMDKMEQGIVQAASLLQHEGGSDAADAIMTTDTFRKQRALTVEIGDKTVTVGGMSKGSGMIHPNMATMLGFVTTDCAITSDCLQLIVSDVTQKTFNMITVDGDTSTNDSLYVLANGLAGNREIKDVADPGFGEIYDAIYALCKYLAIEIARDGEGATKLVSVHVSGAKTPEDARVVAKSICGSNLVKTAVFGEDANWGRILAAAGYSGVLFDPYGVSISIGSSAGLVKVAEQGTGTGFSEEEALKVLQEDEIVLEVKLAEGDAEATAWCCDFSYDYVRINADYRS